MSEIKLPEKLSDCIILALKDEELCFNSPDYDMNMNFYHIPQSLGCVVCFAGAVMAQTLGADPHKKSHPVKFSLYNESRLRALDWIRLGRIQDAMDYLYMGNPLPDRLPVTPYEENRSEWRSYMHYIVKLLQANEL